MLSQSTWNTGCMYRPICSVSELQWGSIDLWERCNFQTSALNLQPFSALLGMQGALVCFGVCVYVLYVCATVIEQRVLLYRPVASMSPPQTHCMLHVFSRMLMCSCPHVCIFSLTVYQERCELQFSLFESLWRTAFVLGRADFRPTGFSQTPLAFLSSGYDLLDVCYN